MLRTLHQFHPSIAYGDAISNDCFEIQRLCWSWGVRSDLFAQEAKPPLRAFVRPHHELPHDRRADEVLAVHLSMGNPALDEMRALPGRRVLVYHNITPASFFSGVNEHAEKWSAVGREQLARFAASTELGIGDSDFNRKELERLGFARTAVVPILVDWAAYDVAPDPAVARMLADERTDVLVVGQILPQKAIHDVVESFARYRAQDRSARLHLVGTTAMSGTYLERLRARVGELGLEDAVRFAGSVSMEELVAYYQGASVLLTLSDHEGFCVPLVEAMRFRLPIVANGGGGAIPETLGDAGILLLEKSPGAVADALDRAVHDATLRAALVEREERRLAEFTPERVGARLRDALASAGLTVPEAAKRRIVVVSSDERCGIHHYSLAVCDGLRASGHEATFLGVVRADTADLHRKMALVRKETDVVLVEHEAGIFREIPFVLALARLRLRGLPVVLSLHELEPGKFHQFRMVGDVIHYRMRFSPALEVARIFWGIWNLLVRYSKYRLVTLLMGAMPARLVTHSTRSREWVDLLTPDPRKRDDFPLVLTPLEDADLPRDESAKRALRDRLGLPTDRFVFVSPGFFFRRKRFLEVLSVLPEDAFLVLSGTESEWDPRYLGEVRDFVKERGLTNVRISTDYEAMGDHVAAADAIVLYYQDVFQSAIATQAVWAGIPAIYSDVPGFALYEGAGLFVRDLESLRAAMRDIREPETYARLQRQIRVLRRMLSPERNAERYFAGLPLER